MKFSLYIIFILFFLCISFCQWPYEPIEQLLPDIQNQDTGSLVSGKIHSINTGQQTCNPSISVDTGKYSRCMLWLGFSGQLQVNVPDSIKDKYKTTGVIQHDRLTITDTSNTVAWFIMREDINVQNELQDPEWSTHPNYIVCLGKDSDDKWDGYAIRLSDRKYIKFCDDILIETSYPHLWVSPDAPDSSGEVSDIEYNDNGFAKQKYINTFFGTSKVKFTYSDRKSGLVLHCADYSTGEPDVFTLQRPAGKLEWHCESGLISPDGNWITYTLRESQFSSNAYIQYIKPTSLPVLVSEDGADPHWWIDPYDPKHPYYIVFAQLKSGYVVRVEFSKEVAQSGAAGRTMKVRLTGSIEDVPQHIGLKPDPGYPPQALITFPFKGGLSPDGLFLATGYLYTYMFTLK